MKFVPYLGRPVVRRAFVIGPRHKILRRTGEIEVTHADTGDCVLATVANTAEVKVGDYIVRLTESDTYHCSAAVFKSRNYVGLTSKALAKKDQFINFIKRTFIKLRRKI